MIALPVVNLVLFLLGAFAGGVFVGWRFFLLMAEWEAIDRQRALLQREVLKEEIRQEMAQAGERKEG